MALAQADPADAGRQALECYALARHVEPVVQVLIVGDQFLDLGVCPVDILRVTGQRAPAERADALAEQRPDIGGHEAGKGEGVFKTLVLGHLADIVAVIERRHAGIPEIDHGRDMHFHGGARRLFDRLPGSLSRLSRHSAMVQPCGR